MLCVYILLYRIYNLIDPKHCKGFMQTFKFSLVFILGYANMAGHFLFF